jgi:uncharacterized protein (TIGR03000 family)
MPERGTVRRFTTPPLTPGEEYHYNVRAQWMENGRPVVRTFSIPVEAGRPATVDFNRQPNGIRPVNQQPINQTPNLGQPTEDRIQNPQPPANPQNQNPRPPVNTQPNNVNPPSISNPNPPSPNNTSGRRPVDQ